MLRDAPGLCMQMVSITFCAETNLNVRINSCLIDIPLLSLGTRQQPTVVMRTVRYTVHYNFYIHHVPHMPHYYQVPTQMQIVVLRNYGRSYITPGYVVSLERLHFKWCI